MKKKKIAIQFASVLLMVFLALISVTLLKVLKMAPLYRAQLYCSCRFVTEQSHEFCEAWTKTPLVPTFLMPLNVNEEKKLVSVKNFTAEAQSAFIGPSEGCRPY